MDDTNINILDTNLKESIKTFFKMQKGRTIDILLLDNSYNKDAKKKGIADITNQTVYNDINEDGADKIHLVIALNTMPEEIHNLVYLSNFNSQKNNVFVLIQNEKNNIMTVHQYILKNLEIFRKKNRQLLEVYIDSIKNAYFILKQIEFIIPRFC